MFPPEPTLRKSMRMNRNFWFGVLAPLASGLAAVAPASAQQPKPNILVIMADDIGYLNISVYNRGMMGYRTPLPLKTRESNSTPP